ncbi:MAG: hypothetical protein IJ086_07375 [Clostridium sp.]|nr:hypothetical protein [Clostridium sp.]MBQ8998489.1 hypothetical protein [Clostridium sp.]
MQQFKFEIIATEHITVEANSKEEAQELAKKMFADFTQYRCNIVSWRNESEWKNTISKCRDEVIECIDERIDDLAESHLEVWEDRYKRKTKGDVIFDLDVNYDTSLEAEDVEDALGFKLNEFEHKYLCETFKEAVLEELF